MSELSAHAASRSIAAIVVAYGPDPLRLNRLLAALGRQCNAVYVIDNGGGREAITTASAFDGWLRIIDMRGNKGLGEALNHGFRLAAAAGFAYATTFDQDSEPAPGQVKALIGAFEDLASRGTKVGAVGPRIVDLRGPKPLEHCFVRRAAGWPSAFECSSEVNYVDTDFLITSGSVISMAAHAEVGPYDAGLFVDYTDMEWCFRALSRGYRLFGICAVTMSHDLSAGESPSAFGMTILSYGPTRRYYYARNVVHLLRMPHVPTGWKARLLLGLIGRVFLLPAALKFSRGWTRHWSLLGRGILDGVMGIGGACSRPR